MIKRKENDLPRNLYHYCPLDSFFGIITNKNIRLCSSKYTNDPNENRIIERIIEKFMSGKGNKEGKLFLQNAIKRFDEEAFNKQYNAPFVFCLSEKSEDLNQWRIYADNGRGITIGFNTESFTFKRVFQYLCISNFTTPRKDLLKIEEVYLDKCIYNPKDQYKLITSLIRRYSSIREITDQQIKEFNLYLKFLSAFFKDPSFREEKEWRIVCFPYTPQFFPPLKREIKYFTKRSVIIPYIEIPLITEPDNPVPDHSIFDFLFIGKNVQNDDSDLSDFVITSVIRFLQIFLRSKIEIQVFS